MTPEARWRLAIGSYLAVQMIVRVLVGPSLELDEAEAFLHSRSLEWGYGPQPPLYFWLQWAFNQVLGETLLSLAALKAALLAVALLGLFELLRRSVPTSAAGVATLSLGLLPQVLWEAQRALTHSVLVLAVAVAAAALFARVLERGRWRDHAVWGVVVGLGLLSKYNFAVWPLALVAAAAWLPDWRTRLRPARLAGAVVVAVAVFAGPGTWMVANLDLATGSADKFGLVPTGLAARAEGTASLALAALSFHAAALLVGAGLVVSGRRKGAQLVWPPIARLLLAATSISILILWVGILASGATSVADRWLLPFAWATAPATVAGLWPALTANARRALGGLVAGFWLLAALLLPYASLVDPGYRAAEWDGLASALREEGAPGVPVVTTSALAGGNLAFHRFGLGESFLARPDKLPAGRLLLLVPAGSAMLGEPAVVRRLASAREASVERADRPLAFVILSLDPA